MDLELQIIGNRLAQSMQGGLIHMDGKAYRADAAVATAFVARELDYVKRKTFDVTKVALKARQYLPVSFEAHPGAEVVSYDQYDSFGEAEVVDSYSGDAPRVDASKQNFQNKVFGLRAAYGFSIQDLRAIAMSGSRLRTARAMQSRRAHESKLEAIAATGVPALGKTGFVNNASVSLFGTSFAWDMTTPASTIKRDIGALVQSVVIGSSHVWEPDTLLLPTQAYAIASEKSFGTDNARSVLKVILDESPYIKRIGQWSKLDGAGAGSTDRCVVYKYSEDVAALEIPQDYEEFPPEVRGLEFLIHSHMRTAGVSIQYPMGMAYADGTFDASDITP